MRAFGTLALLSALFLANCTTEEVRSSGYFGKDTSNPVRSSKKQNSANGTVSQAAQQPIPLSRGNDEFINKDALRNGAKSTAIIVPRDGKTVEISLVNASIRSAAQVVLGESLNKRFTVSDDVSGTITIQSTGPIPKDALLELFEAALSANGARLEKQGNVIKVLPGTSGNRTFQMAQNGAATGASIVVAPLKNVSASQMTNLLAPLIEEGLDVVADKRRNLLLMTGSGSQLEAALDALNLFDVDVLAGKSVALVRVNSAEPDAIVDELNLIFETEEGGGLQDVIEFVPNNRLGSVLIITSRSKYLAKAQKWIRNLDRAAVGAQQYIVTYELQNRKASEVAPILQQLLSSGSETASITEAAVDVVSTQGSSRVAADEGRNAVLIKGTRAEHSEIRKLLKDVDSSPQQVMLEATIVEVTLNDELDLGVRWFFQDGNFDLTFSDVASGAVASSYPGFSGVFGSNSADVAINALAGVTDVKVISSPTLMVLDNEEAILQIGDQVPVATQSSTSTSGANAPVVTTIEYRDTGVILKVKPNISRNGRVVLEITQEVSDVAATQTSGIDSPTIRQRKITTNVLLDDGNTLALGGLVQENDTKTISKVPGLGDIPGIGAMFRNTKSGKKRSELLILIRPRVVHDTQSARTVTQEWRNKLSGADTLLSNGLGSSRHSIKEVFY